MSASISMKKKTVGMDFLKRTSGIITGATGAYISEVMPVTTSTLSEAKNTVSSVSTAFANTSQAVLPKIRQLRTQVTFRGINNWFMSKEDDYSDFGVNDSNLSFDVSTDPTDIAEVQISELGRNANQISQAVVESSHKMVESQLAATANLMNTAEKQTAVITAGFDKTNETLNKILEVLTKNTSTLIETSVANSKRSANDDMASNGKFNLSEYKKIISGNFKNSQLGTMATLIPAMLGDKEMIKQFISPESVTQMLIGAVVNKKSPNLKKNMKALDDVINETVMTSLIRLGENDSYGIKGQIAKMFGIDSSRKETNTSRSTLELKTVPFDSIAHESLTNAIPGYLRKILVAVGGPDEVYDYRSRSFRSKTSIRKDFHDTAASKGNLYGASGKVRGAMGTDQFSNMVYDMMMSELGSRTSGGSARRTVDRFSNQKDAQNYILNTILKDVNLSRAEQNAAKQFSKNLGNASSGMGGIDIMNQVARNNVNRNTRMRRYVDGANAYNVDLSDIRDSVGSDLNNIAESYGKRRNSNTLSSSVSDKGNRTGELSGQNYTNIALFEIYRKLNKGINVFQVGANNRQSDPFVNYGEKYLQKPQNYRTKPMMDNTSTRESLVTRVTGGSDLSGESNLLRNQQLEDGSTEDLTKGQRFVRWGKNRGGNLARALFSGSPEQVKDAFTLMFRDVGQVAGDGVKRGAAKLNESSGNFSGYLKHKITGAGYKYKDDDGNDVVIDKNDKGGVLGYFDELIFGDGGAKGLMKRTSSAGSKWFKSIAGYFNYGSKDPDEQRVAGKRKTILGTSVGAMIGMGILGGPLGIIMGGIAGSAISQTDGIGAKLKNILFGDKDHEGDKKKDRNKRRGLIGRAVDGIVDPIRYQVGKTMTTFGSVLKKNILGPLSNIGAAIKERMSSAAGGVVSKVFGGIFKGATGMLKKLIMLPLNIAKAPINAIGGLTRGVAEGGGALAGGFLNSIAKGIAGKNGRSTINERIAGQKNDAREDKAASGYFGKYVHEVERDENGNIIYENGQPKMKMKVDAKGRPIKAKRKGFSADYKDWKEDQDHARDQRGTIDDYTAERKLSKEEIEAAEAAKRTAENTSEIAENNQTLTDAVTGEIIPGSSFKSHDAGVHERLDTLIEISKNTNKNSSSIQDGSISHSIVPTSMTSSKNNKDQNVSFANTLVGAAAQISGSGGYDDKDVDDMEGIASASQQGASKNTMFGKFKDILNRNKDKGDDTKKEKKEKSFLSDMIGGIGKVLMDNWPLVLAGISLLSSEFRDFLGKAVSKLTDWLGDNLPSIIKGAWDLVTGINREVENDATGSSTITDEVTNEKKSVTSAKQHAEHIQAGTLESAKDITLHSGRLLKDFAIISGERAGLRLGSSVVQGGANVVSGIGSMTNFGAKTFQTGSAFFQGVKQGGIKQGANFAGRAWTLGGSKTAQTVASGATKTATSAGGFKTMLSKTLNPKTLLKPTAIANIAGGVVTDISAGIGWESAEIAKNGNIVGDYGFNRNAGGFARTNTTVKTVTTTSLGVAGGIAIGAAVGLAKTTIAASIATAAGGAAVAGGVNSWNPIGWCTLIIAGVLILAAGIAALVNWLTGLFTDGANKDYSIRSNSSKLNGVVNGTVSYENGKDNPMYVYCGQESDRVLGLNKGMNIKDPDYVFGKYLKQIADGLTSSPGTEVLLYDFIHNMAVQGVPFACLLAGDSDECKADGDQANTNSTGTPPSTRSGPFGGKYTEVRKSTVEKNKSKVLADIASNISRQDSSCVWNEQDLKITYEAGKAVVDALKSKSILNNDGQVNTDKFKGSPGGKNADGWKSLEELTRQKDSYFLTQCLVYINAKIEATKEGKQWLEDRKDDVLKLMENLKDLFVKESQSQVAEMKRQGMSDNEIDEALVSMRDPKGNKATGASDLSKPTTSTMATVGNSSIKSSDKADVDKELKYLTSSYVYAHPSVLQEWVDKHQNDSGISKDNLNRVGNWKTQFSSDKRKQKVLRGEMAAASQRFADSAGDIFNLVPQFDWNTGGKIYTGKKNAASEKYGSGFVIRGEEKKPNEGILSSLWNAGEVGPDKTPDDIHDELFGDKNHGKGSEAAGAKGKWWAWTSGVLGRIAEKISQYGSSSGEKLAIGSEKDKWRNILTNLPSNNPPKLTGIGGDDSEPHSATESAPVQQASPKEGGNPLNTAAKITSSYGYRVLDGKNEFHKGIDLVPQNGSRNAEIGARFSGTIADVKSNLPNSHTGLGVRSNQMGNFVKLDTPSGQRVTYMHLAANSIPSSIKKGTKVSIGDKIGNMGTTGRSTGPHLHYQFNDIATGNPINPISSILGGSQMSSFNGASDASATSEGFPDEYVDSSLSVSETGESSNGLSAFIDKLKNLGMDFLSFITGGLISSTSQESGSQEIAYDENGMSTGTSGNMGLVDGPVELLSTKQVAAIQTKREKKEIIDLTTGKSFFVSWAASPGYHSDWTPWSPDDVKTVWSFLHPNGGGNMNNTEDWDWNARPGVLKLNGRMIACGFHLRPHHNIMGGNPGAPFRNGGDRVNGKWLMGGHMCMYYGDSPGGTPKCNDAAKEAYVLGNKMFKAQADNMTASTVGASNGILGTGQTLTVPDSYGTYVTYEKEILKGKYNHATHGWSSSSAQGQMRKDAIAKGRIKPSDMYGLQNVATVDGRALIATPWPKIGNQLPVNVGDHLDVQFSDGSVWNTMVGDTKNPNDSGSTVWGHGNGKNTVELIYWDYNKNPKNVNKKVSSITKTGKNYNNSVGSQSQINATMTASAPATGVETAVGGPTEDMGNSNLGNINYTTKANLSRKSPISNINSIINRVSSPFHSTDASLEGNNDVIPLESKSGGVVNHIETLLMQVISELRSINNNTGTSSSLLDSLNGKDFIDKGLRDSITAVGKNQKKQVNRHVAGNNNNVRTVAAMARP